jgi:hypothetical protein
VVCGLRSRSIRLLRTQRPQEIPRRDICCRELCRPRKVSWLRCWSDEPEQEPKLMRWDGRAEKLSGAGRIQSIGDAPGGGFLLELSDPEGFPVNLMFGQKEVESLKYPDVLLINSENHKPRKRTFQRFQPGPAAVHKVCITRIDGGFLATILLLQRTGRVADRCFSTCSWDTMAFVYRSSTNRSIGIHVNSISSQQTSCMSKTRPRK